MSFLGVKQRKITVEVQALIQEIKMMECRLSESMNQRDQLIREMEELRGHHLNRLTISGIVDIGASAQIVNALSGLKDELDKVCAVIYRLSNDIETRKASLALLRRKERKYQEYASLLNVEVLRSREALINAEAQEQYLLGKRGGRHV